MRPKLKGVSIAAAPRAFDNPEAVATGADRVVRLQLVATSSIGPGPIAGKIRFSDKGTVKVLWRFHLDDGSDHYAELPQVGRNHCAGVVALPGLLTSITLEISGSGDLEDYREISLQPLKGFGWLLLLVRRALRAGIRRLSRIRQFASLSEGVRSRADYEMWMARFDERPDLDRDLHLARAAQLSAGPLISLLMHVRSDSSNLWQATLASLKAQAYPHWELILLAEQDARQEVDSLLDRGDADSRISVRDAPKGEADAYNEGLRFARGSFIGVLPPGACLPAHALVELAGQIASNSQADLLYTDEDRVDARGRRHSPRFKPGWSPDYLRSRDYLGNLTIYRADTVRKLGGWRPLAGAEDFDLKLRVADNASRIPKAILHVPKVLIHLPDNLATKEVARKPTSAQAPSDSIAQQGLRALPMSTWPHTGVSELEPLITIIVPTRDQGDLVRACVRSILDRTTYRAYEVIIVDNGSREAATGAVFRELTQDERVRILDYPHPFNYSAINNYAVRHARGSVLTLLNNDVEVVTAGWLSNMVAHATRPEIGCVGAKLLYPDGTIQHAGILLGVAGLAGHAHRHAPGGASGYLGRLQSVLNVSAVTGACLVVRRETFDEVGGLDEVGLSTAFNDVDFCLKVRAAGYLNLWTPDAVLIHHESKTRGYEWTRAKRARLAREEDIMRRRWGRALLEDPYYSRHLTRLSEDFRIRRI